ncbi:MAG TPA: phosphoglucosamine mutase [Thermotogota bacterium]|nr:phosphoglucosamine mutase [Thermotogota bacterium]
MRRLFGTDGIRGVAGKEISADLAFRLGNAVAQIVMEDGINTLIIAKDTRVSCDMLEYAVASGASSAGMDVRCCGIMPTPALAKVTEIYKAAGVMISASHNSFEYNGLKVMKTGYKLPDREEAEIEEIILAGSIRAQTHHALGRITRFPEARGTYLRELYKHFDELDLSAFHKTEKKPFHIVFDASNGASYSIAPEVYRTLGATVTVINDQPDGFNINLNCGSQHTKKLAETVLELRADIGIAHDGDADRCILIDEKGNEVDGDKIMAITANYYREINKLNNNLVISTVMSNLGFETYLREQKIELKRTRVGDRYVLEEMLKSDAVIGGEQSGHIIYLDKNSTGDGLITSLTVLQTMMHFGRMLSELIDEIPRFPQILKNVRINDKERVMESSALASKLEEVRNCLRDSGRVLVRPSGTEPLVRVMLEGKEEKQIEDLCNEIIDVIKENDA